MFRSAAAAFIVGISVGLAGAGCGDVDVPDHPDPLDHRGGDETQDLRLQTKDVSFVPKELTARTGVTTELTLENLDEGEHDFQVDEIDAAVIEGDDEQGEHGGGHTGSLSVHANGGDTDSVAFVINEPGTYEFYCTITGHREAGMVGTLTVE